MNYYTTDLYETKREIVNFSKKVTEGVNKSTSKFVMDMIYGISKSKSCLISEISRSLEEKISLNYTIERLCDNLNNIKEEEINVIKENYLKEIEDLFDEEAISIFDDSDIAKPYGKKFEDLDKIIDASSIDGKVVSGYHVCEAAILSKNQKQPISVYSKIYSCKSDCFESKNKYTIESIDVVRNVLKRKCNMIFDRGYDDNKLIDYIDKNGDYFVIRMNDKRNFLFKGKKKNCYKEAIKRKGKVRMELWFDDNEKYEVYVSHTKVTLPYNKKEYELVIVYGLSEERPLILLTNRNIKSKEDVIKVVRMYFYRWRIEEYFRAKKQEYKFEDMRIRTLKGMNVLNLILTIHLGHIGKLVEKLDKKLLTIKIIERSKSLRNKILVWISQMSRGISEILKYAKVGIKEWQKIEKRDKYKQLELKL